MIGEETELELSDRVTVTVAELDGLELSKAEARADDQIDLSGVDMNNPDKLTEAMLKGKSSNQARTLAICSIRSLRGEKVAPLANIVQYGRVAQQLNSREINELMKWAQPLYAPTEEQLKKGSAEGASETTSS